MNTPDVAWTLMAAMLVFLMHAGFGFYESGMCRKKNTVSTITHNVVILVVTVTVFWLSGFAFMYGEGNAIVGWHGFAPEFSGSEHLFPTLQTKTVPLAVAFTFALACSDTPATLIAGSGAERVRLGAVIVLTLLVSGLLFPIVGRWVLGRGWLTELIVPVYDTGAGAIQLCGGACALAVSLTVGPRKGRFDHRDQRQFGVSSMPNVFLGAFTLWIGFIAFDGGYAMHLGRSTGLVVIEAILSPAAAAIATLVGARVLTGKSDLRTMLVGLLTACVAICSAAGVVSIWGSVAIGIAAGTATLGSIHLLARLKVDDPTEYVTMNLIGGAIGMLAVGLFASPAVIRSGEIAHPPAAGALYGSAAQLGSQAIGVVVIGSASFALTLFAARVLDHFDRLRVPSQEEDEGADRPQHGELAGGAEREPQP